MITGTPCAGNLVDSRLKELLPALPVVYVKAVPVQVCPFVSRTFWIFHIIISSNFSDHLCNEYTPIKSTPSSVYTPVRARTRPKPTCCFLLPTQNLQSTWEPSAVGYLRHDPKIYEAPVYITSFRGPTYVFLATLKTEDPVSKWTLTGTAVLLQTDD